MNRVTKQPEHILLSRATLAQIVFCRAPAFTRHHSMYSDGTCNGTAFEKVVVRGFHHLGFQLFAISSVMINLRYQCSELELISIPKLSN